MPDSDKNEVDSNKKSLLPTDRIRNSDENEGWLLLENYWLSESYSSFFIFYQNAYTIINFM